MVKKAVLGKKTTDKPKNSVKVGSEKALAVYKKSNYKVPPAAVQIILDLTLQGLSITEIIQHIRDTFSISISKNLVGYYRRTNKSKLLSAVEDDIAAARAMYPDSMLLVGRIGVIDAATKKEMSKKRPSGYVIASLIGSANQAIYQMEMLRLRYMELAKKYPTNKADDFEKFSRELERRSHFARDVTNNVSEMEMLAGGDFASDDESS